MHPTFRKYTIPLLTALLSFWSMAGVCLGQSPEPAPSEPSAADLFNVRELEASNPFVLAGLAKPVAVTAATKTVTASGLTFLVDTAYRMPRILPPLPESETWEAGPLLAAQPNPFAQNATVAPTEAPSEISSPIEQQVAEAPATEPVHRDIPSTGGWFFYVLLTILAYLTLLASVYRDELRRLFLAFANMNMAMQAFRDRGRFLSFHDLLLYLLFVMTGGALVYLIVLMASGGILQIKPWWALLACMGAVALVYLLKHLQLLLISAIFSFGGETLFYSFLVGNANKTLGVVLVPLVFFAAYAPEALKPMAVILALTACALVYLYRSGRGFALASTYLLSHKFHFFLYLCAVEIAPIAALVKIILISAGR